MTALPCLPARLDLTTAGELVEMLRAVPDGDVTLDGSHIRHVGTPGLQILLSARQTVEAAGNTFAIVGASDEVCAQVAQFGLESSVLGIFQSTEAEA